MSANFPTSLDSYATISSGDTISEAHPNDRGDAIEALEAKVGIDSSAVATSHTYLLTHLPAQAQAWDLGSYNFRALTLQSDVVTGTAPLTVASTTLVSNLNSDLLDGQEGAHYLALGNATGTAAIARGGTNITTYTQGDILYCSATNVLSKLAKGTNGHYLKMGATIPAWAALAIKTTLDSLDDVSAITETQGQIIYRGASTWDALNIGTAGKYLKSQGAANNPVWGTIALASEVAGTLPIGNGGTGSVSTTYCNLTTNVTGTLPVEKGGTGATAAANAANGVVVLGADGYLPNATVDTTSLKTAETELNTTGSQGNFAVTGGQYCFYPQIKSTGSGQWYIGYGTPGATYRTNIYINDIPEQGYDQYAKFRYVTASGEDYWIFLLVDKTTKEVLSMSASSDHPAYGNSNDFEETPHPFNEFNIETQEMILIEREQAKQIKLNVKEKGIGVLELINKIYKINFDENINYKPIHSGKFSPNHKPVLVDTIPNYIKTKKLILMSENDKKIKNDIKKERLKKFKLIRIEKENEKKEILSKLRITEREMKIIITSG